MAVGVIYRFEFIQIDHQDTQTSFRIFRSVSQVRVETPSIKHGRKRVRSSVGQLVRSFFNGSNNAFNPVDCFLNLQVL